MQYVEKEMHQIDENRFFAELNKNDFFENRPALLNTQISSPTQNNCKYPVHITRQTIADRTRRTRCIYLYVWFGLLGNTYTINYLTQRQEHLANRVVAAEAVVVEHVQMEDARLQLLDGKALEVECLVPARIQGATLDLRFQAVLFVRQQRHLDVRIGGAAQVFGRQLFALHDLQDERGVLEVVLDGEVNLADVLAGLGVVDVHVHHADAAVLLGRTETREEKELTFVETWRACRWLSVCLPRLCLRRRRHRHSNRPASVSADWTICAGANGERDVWCLVIYWIF